MTKKTRKPVTPKVLTEGISYPVVNTDAQEWKDRYKAISQGIKFRIKRNNRWRGSNPANKYTTGLSAMSQVCCQDTKAYRLPEAMERGEFVAFTFMVRNLEADPNYMDKILANLDDLKFKEESVLA